MLLAPPSTFDALQVDNAGYPIIPGMPRLRQFLELVAADKSLTEARRITGLLPQRVWDARRKYPQVEDAFQVAAEIARQAVAAECIAMADAATDEDVALVRLRIDTRKWASGRKFGGANGGKSGGVTVNAPDARILIGSVIAAATARRGEEPPAA